MYTFNRIGRSHVTIAHNIENGGSQEIADIQRQALIHQTSGDTGFNADQLEAAHTRIVEMQKVEAQERIQERDAILSLFADGPGIGAKEKSAPQRNYTVQKGDTLSKIAFQYRTTTTELAKLNDITDENIIKIGQVIQLSGDTNTEVSSRSKVKPIVAPIPVLSSSVVQSDETKSPTEARNITELQSLIQKNDTDLKEMRAIIRKPETTTNDRIILVSAVNALDKNNNALQNQLSELNRAESIAKVNNENRANSVATIRRVDNAAVTPNERALQQLIPIKKIDDISIEAKGLHEIFSTAIIKHEENKPNMADATPNNLSKITQYGDILNKLRTGKLGATKIGLDISQRQNQLKNIKMAIKNTPIQQQGTLNTQVARYNQIVTSTESNNTQQIASIKNSNLTQLAQSIVDAPNTVT